MAIGKRWPKLLFGYEKTFGKVFAMRLPNAVKEMIIST